ncbi:MULTISPECIES: DUF1329 domain-containing protein [unclassified Duganella]|uniref:DUF1329 domain-containing protein n=1 Tax=unclassified Duganella TaxID=2636909 RepID=UPI00088EE393|nr:MULTISPECIES: DUF1329 domain-containing protein [unclassified Duganella]SDG71423.1 Protein of unknown function [Duganella sp. OV458]SDJ97148.1 Protein of unknown function [Duganella sp. OV510]
MKKNISTWLALGLASIVATAAAQAPNLKSGALTPMGAERAGNKDGSIPAWDGKAVDTKPGADNKRPDPYASEKPVLAINAANVAQYADKLSDGTRALLAKWPGMRIDVYPSHRSAVFSQAIYDAVAANATRAKLTNGGLTVEGAYGGIPFPVPKNGHEALWNHMLSYRGQLTTFTADKYVMTSGGDRVLTNRQRTNLAYPYYDPKGKPDGFSGEWARARLDVTEPPANAGQALMTIDYVDNYTRPKDGWQYVPGQRRVRKSPSLVYDTPDASAAGLANFDDVNLFIGAQDRYEVKLMGKKEIYIPYNNNGLFRKPVNAVIGKGTLNPDAVRWELHRVWVLEASLANGKRNVAAKRRLYLDEDTWQAVLADTWDAQGKLWKTGQAYTLLAGDEPSASTLSYTWYDLLSGGWVYAAAINETGGVSYQDYDARQLSKFTSSALASGGVR